MNRKETKLLVENWRNLITEDKGDSELEEDERKSKNIRLSLNSGIKISGSGTFYFLDSPDFWIVLDKKDLNSIKEFMSVKELASPQKLSKNPKKIEICKSAYETLMKLENPTNIAFIATYGSEGDANIVLSKLDTLLGGKFQINYNCTFDERNEYTNDPVWKDGDQVKYEITNLIDTLEDTSVQSGRIVKQEIINPSRFLGRISLLHLIINAVPEDEKAQIIGKNVENWFLSSKAIKPRELK